MDVFVCTAVGKRICTFFVCPKILYVTFLFVVILVHTVVGEKTVYKICCICKLVRVKIGQTMSRGCYFSKFKNMY